MSYVTVSAEVDVDVEEVLDRLSANEISKLLKRHIARQGINVERGLGDGDTAHANAIIERAAAAVRRLPSVPREIEDLFWHVHGRAI